MRSRLLLLAVLLAGLLTAPAAVGAPAVRVPVAAVAANPANAPAFAMVAVDAARYDPARRCVRTPRPGMVALVRWLTVQRDRGMSWGTFRCELWGAGSASLHAEGRALDWHLNVADPADRREADALIALLLAPDRAGEPHALARRMGVQELIWDCRYWAAGMREFRPYSPCHGTSGKPRKRVNVTVAHRDHVHIGMSKAGAMGRTSFWTRPAGRPKSDDGPLGPEAQPRPSGTGGVPAR